jgi:predicted Rossmann fold flavoprotein
VYDVIIIGAGPAGLLAAITAAKNNSKVLLIEKMEKPARKLRITGKGRCNITNTKTIDEFLKKVYPDKRFLKPALKNLTNARLIEFINDIGIPTVAERGDRVFPASQKAWDVANALVNEAERSGVEIVCHTKVEQLFTENEHIKAVVCETKQGIRIFKAKAVVIATGGLSYPATGSTGDGYKLAEDAGHTITSLRPSLTAIEIDKPDNRLDKLELKNVELSVWVDGNCVNKEFGEMEFTSFGIDGAIVLRISRTIVDALIGGKKVKLMLDLKPALSVEQLSNRIEREIRQLPPTSTSTILLSKLLPKQFIVTFAERLSIQANKAINKLTGGEIKKIITGLKSYPMLACGYRPFTEAIITAGGVALNEINPKTMQSKIIENLYFAGEIIDLDADTGGYNLQIAFSTGYLAGLSAAKYSKAQS